MSASSDWNAISYNTRHKQTIKQLTTECVVEKSTRVLRDYCKQYKFKLDVTKFSGLKEEAIKSLPDWHRPINCEVLDIVTCMWDRERTPGHIRGFIARIMVEKK